MRPNAIIAAVSLSLLTLPALAKDDYEVITVERGATIQGKVQFEGKVPPAVAVNQDHKTCGKTSPDPNLVAKDGKLSGALVFLKKVKRGKAFTEEQKIALSDQRKCIVIPHVSLVARGGQVTFKNSDDVLHNVRANSIRNGSFNEAVEAGKTLVKTFKRGPDEIKISCSVHPFMASYVIVMPHPYYAVTDAKGDYSISDIPPGKYKLMVWHGKLGKQAKASLDGKSAKISKKGLKLELAPEGKRRLDITFSRTEN